MRRSFDGSYKITTPFGEYDASAYANYPGSRHPGTDYATPANTALLAGMSGTITNVIFRNTYVGRGNEIVLTNGNTQRRYCHLNRIDVRPGQNVSEGQQIGLTGNTGYVLPKPTAANPTAGAHLHDELLVDGKYTDLEAYLNNERNNDMLIQDTDNWYARMNQLHEQILGEPMTREVFSRAVAGRELLHMIEYMSDEWRATNALQAQRLGQQAIREDWQGKLQMLLAQVEALSKNPTKPQFDELKAQADACRVSLTEAQTKQAAAETKAAELETEKADNEKKATGFLQIFANILKRFK